MQKSNIKKKNFKKCACVADKHTFRSLVVAQQVVLITQVVRRLPWVFVLYALCYCLSTKVNTHEINRAWKVNVSECESKAFRAKRKNAGRFGALWRAGYLSAECSPFFLWTSVFYNSRFERMCFEIERLAGLIEHECFLIERVYSLCSHTLRERESCSKLILCVFSLTLSAPVQLLRLLLFLTKRFVRFWFVYYYFFFCIGFEGLFCVNSQRARVRLLFSFVLLHTSNSIC